MKNLLLLSLFTGVTFSAIAQDDSATQSSNAQVIDAIVASLYEEDKPACYHFTDEVPPEEFIGFPECDITPSVISGAVEVGSFFNTGDKDYAIGIVKSDLKHEVGKMRTNWKMEFFGRKSEETNDDGDKEYVTTDQKWGTSLQSNYTLEEGGKNYLFGYGSYEDDRFNGFDYQSSIAAGWGRRWYESDVAFFDAEIGPGFKVDEIAETDEHNNKTETSTIIRAAATYERRFFETMEFKQTFSAEVATSSNENSKYKSVSSITTKLIESLALKFAFTVDHNSVVENDTEKTRTETSLTLVYSI